MYSYKRPFAFLITFELLMIICCQAIALENDVIATIYVSQNVSSYLRGRDSASLKGSVEARFYAGDCLEVVEFADDWTRVKGGEGGTVWVCAEYTTSVEPSGDPTVYVVTGNGRVHVRNSPEGDHVRWAEIGETVSVYEIVDGWAKIEDGYINADYLGCSR